jgi:hypothetical protein
MDEMQTMPVQDQEAIEGEIVADEAPPFKIGDAVAVKAGVEDPDDGRDIGGWQGRVTGYDEEDPNLVEFDWDSIALRAFTFDELMDLEAEGLKWWTMRLYREDLEPATPRDTEEDVARVREELQAKIDEEEPITGMLRGDRPHGRAVLDLVERMPTHDQQTVREAWHTYLQSALKLPFIAELYADGPRPWRRGDRVTVRAITRLDPEAGTMVRVEHKRLGGREFPLDDLDIPTKSAANYDLLSEYIDWRDERPLQDRPGMEGLRELQELQRLLRERDLESLL